MKKIFITVALFLGLTNFSVVKSQDREGIFNMYYSMALPMGDLHDYISKYSWRGFGMEYKTEVYDNLTMGIGGEWNVFYADMDKNAVYEKDNVAISGKQFRYVNAFPMTARFNWFKDSEGSGLRIFAGAGIGTTYLIKDLDMGIYRLNIDTWQFLIAPEAGVQYDINPNNTLMVSVKYNLNFKNQTDAGQSYLGINVGFGFR